jgi:hypothetical protein
MLLAFHNNAQYVIILNASGGAVVGGIGSREIQYNLNASGGVVLSGINQAEETEISKGGTSVGGRAICQLIESHLGWKCKMSAKYIKAKYVEAGSNIKRRDYTGRPKSKALVAAITICNQNMDKLFEGE